MVSRAAPVIEDNQKTTGASVLKLKPRQAGYEEEGAPSFSASI